jgi:hypothetical protein
MVSQNFTDWQPTWNATYSPVGKIKQRGSLELNIDAADTFTKVVGLASWFKEYIAATEDVMQVNTLTVGWNTQVNA